MVEGQLWDYGTAGHIMQSGNGMMNLSTQFTVFFIRFHTSTCATVFSNLGY